MAAPGVVDQQVEPALPLLHAREEMRDTSSSFVWSQGTAMPLPPTRVTSSAVSSMLPGTAGSLDSASSLPYTAPGAPRVLRPVT
jgi:hypothetical protein